MTGYYHGGGWSGGDWIAMAVMMVAFWGIVIGLIVWALRSLRAPRGVIHTEPTPVGILAARYARGEIEDDEYRRRSDTLVSSGTR